MENILEISLITLCLTTAVCAIILTVYIVKLIITAKALCNNIDKAMEIVNGDLKPLVADIRETVSGANSIMKAADNRVKVINCALNGVVGATGILGGKLKGVLQGVVEGFRAGVNLFKK